MRPLLALVIALFCLPLFIGLNGLDLRGDEAAHSFSVDRILETGRWIFPMSSPWENEVFLEKPPLKFWIVAAGIRSGLLPHTEFGLRFWDSLFTSGAFLYVFFIGRRLAGALCGATAVLVLFVHAPLLFEHGLRGNNMEAALLLGYCGAFYHYLAWTTAQGAPGRRWHPVAVGLFFTLGFMVKFIAAMFLPIVLGLASLAIPVYRTRLVRDWRVWAAASLLALALIAPWFAYAQYTFGMDFWRVIFGAHVYTRLTAGLDPSHLHPWHYYFTQLYEGLKSSNTWLLTAAGGIVLLVDTIRRRWAEGALVLLWFALPFCLISLLASKLYYYADPFLPPVALAGGYMMAFLWARLRPRVRRVLDSLDRGDAGGWATRLTTIQLRPALQSLFLVLAIAASAIIVWSIVVGPVRITVGDTVLLKSSRILRPWLIAIVCGTLAGRAKEFVAFLGVPLLMLSLLPVPAYRGTLERIVVQNHPMRSARDCIRSVRAETGTADSWHGLYVAGPDSAFGHAHIYYFRGFRPWERTQTPSDAALYGYLYDPSAQRPVLLDNTYYGPFGNRLFMGAIPAAREQPPSATPPDFVQLDDALMLLPGPYAVCGTVELHR